MLLREQAGTQEHEVGSSRTLLDSIYIAGYALPSRIGFGIGSASLLPGRICRVEDCTT